jgi:hypothetical protein
MCLQFLSCVIFLKGKMKNKYSFTFETQIYDFQHTDLYFRLIYKQTKKSLKNQEPFCHGAFLVVFSKLPILLLGRLERVDFWREIARPSEACK